MLTAGNIEIDTMNEHPDVERLRRAVVNDPRNAELRYLLGAEMAQQKDYDGAVMEMSSAIALNPLLHVARFQLGLLHLTMARPDHAIAVLGPLENLSDASALKFFKRGLEALIEDKFEKCVDNLRTGIELNRENAPLNRDMTMLLERVLKIAPTNDASHAQSEAADVNEVRTDFSLYTTKN